MFLRSLLLLVASFYGTLTLVSSRSHYDDQKFKNAIQLKSRVGSHVAFVYNLEFPTDYPIPFHLTYTKDNITIFTYEAGETRASERYDGRINFIDKQSSSAKVSLNLTSVRETDSGWYACTLNFPNRTPQTMRTTFYHLEVDGDSLMRIPPVNQTVHEGNAAVFDCVVKDLSTMSVTWLKDGKLISSYNDLLSRCIQHPNGSLTIRETLMNDLGFYECRVKKILGGEESARAFLNVQYKAKVIYTEKEIFYAIGGSAMLDCHFRANPPLLTLRWEKDGFLFDAYNVKDVFYKHNGSLYFRHVRNNHAGKYTCTPYNDLGTMGPSEIMDIIVQHPPEFIVKPKSVYVKRNGENITINCTATAHQEEKENDHVDVEWRRKDGIPLPLKRHTVKGGNLTIQNLSVDDRGIYICSAKNEAAKLETEVEIIIETFAPKAPSNLTVASSKNSVTLRWIQNYIRSEIRFTIFYRQVDKKVEEWKTQRVNFSGEFETTISNLLEAKEYEFMVLSQDRYNDGLLSKPIRCSTKDHTFNDEEITGSMAAFTQIGPPKNLLINSKSDGYLISWQAPDYGNDVLNSYIVRWYREPSHELVGRRETREHFINVPVDELQDGMLYNFQVSSVSHNQVEAFSKEYELKTNHRSTVMWIVATLSVFLLLMAFIGFSFYGINVFKQRGIRF